MKLVASRFLVCLLISSGMLCAGLVSAEEQTEDSIVCAAVVPCDKDGSVLPAFSKGACASYYEAICSQQYLNELTAQLAQCTSGQSTLSAQVRSLRSRLAKVKRAVRTSR